MQIIYKPVPIRVTTSRYSSVNSRMQANSRTIHVPWFASSGSIDRRRHIRCESLYVCHVRRDAYKHVKYRVYYIYSCVSVCSHTKRTNVLLCIVHAFQCEFYAPYRFAREYVRPRERLLLLLTSSFFSSSFSLPRPVCILRGP